MIRGVVPSSGSSSGGYVRPADWPSMPVTATNKIDVLAAVYNTDSNFVAFAVTATGGFTVNWGDGTAPQNYTSGSVALYKYDYAASGLGALTAEGYKTASISITPTTGANITAFDFGWNNNSVIGLSNYVNPWLDIQVNAPACSSIAFKSLLSCTSLNRVVFKAIGDLTDISYLFQGCFGLQYVEFPSASLANVTTLAHCFDGCASLVYVNFPEGSLGSTTTIAYCFNACTSLRSIAFPAGALANVSNLDFCFTSCSSLESLTFPSGSLAAVTSMARCFQAATSLEYLSFPSGALALVGSLSRCFQSCSSLKNITFPSGSLVSTTDISYCFNGCSSLLHVSFPSGSLVSLTNISSCFYNCASLRRILFPTGALASLSSVDSWAYGCSSLSDIVNASIPVDVSVTNAMFSATGLNAIYTALPIVTGKTISRTGNYGVSSDTPSIATAKGWTVA